MKQKTVKLFICFLSLSMFLFSCATYQNIKTIDTPVCDIKNTQVIDLVQVGNKIPRSIRIIKNSTLNEVLKKYLYGFDSLTKTWNKVELNDSWCCQNSGKYRFIALAGDTSLDNVQFDYSCKVKVERLFGVLFLLDNEAQINIESFSFVKTNEKAIPDTEIVQEISHSKKVDAAIRGFGIENNVFTYRIKIGNKIIFEKKYDYNPENIEIQIIDYSAENCYFALKDSDSKILYKNTELISKDVKDHFYNNKSLYYTKKESYNTYSIYREKNCIVNDIYGLRDFVVSSKGEIAYSTIDKSGAMNIYKNGKFFATTKDMFVSPTYSPDGNKFYYMIARSSRYSVAFTPQGPDLSWNPNKGFFKPNGYGTFIFSNDSKYVAWHGQDGDGYHWILRNDKFKGPYKDIKPGFHFSDDSKSFIFTHIDNNTGAWIEEIEKL